MDNLTFGIELEFFNRQLDEKDIRKALQDNDINQSWLIKHDINGFEINSPILTGIEDINEVSKVGRLLLDLDCKVGIQHGLHVHLGADFLGIERIKNIVNRWKNNEHYLNSIQPLTRRDNFYCGRLSQKIDLKKLNELNNLNELVNVQTDRNCKINLLAYDKHKTIEFRQHNGTLNPVKISNWINFLINFSLNTTPENVNDLGFNALFYDRNIRDFYFKRMLRLRVTQEIKSKKLLTFPSDLSKLSSKELAELKSKVLKDLKNFTRNCRIRDEKYKEQLNNENIK